VVEHKYKLVPKEVNAIKYVTKTRKVPKTIYETKTRQVAKTVFNPATETLYRDVPVTKTRKVKKTIQNPESETKYRVEYETKYETVQEKRYKNEPETRYREEKVKKFRTITENKTRQVPSIIKEDRKRQVPVTKYENNPNKWDINVPVDGTHQFMNAETWKLFNEDGVAYDKTLWVNEERPVTVIDPYTIERDNLTAVTSFKDEHYQVDKTVYIDEDYTEDRL